MSIWRRLTARRPVGATAWPQPGHSHAVAQWGHPAHFTGNGHPASVDILGVREATAIQQFLQAAGYGYNGVLANRQAIVAAAPPSPPRPVTDRLLLPQPTSRTSAYWQQFPPCYRAQEMQTFAHWITACVSGAVIGLPGMGKSNLLNFLCQRPDALRRYLPDERAAVVLIPVDLNNLLELTLSALYRLFVCADSMKGATILTRSSNP